MFEGYLIAKRSLEVDQDTLELGFGRPGIFARGEVTPIRCKDHSWREGYMFINEPGDFEVFFIRINDADVEAVRADPESYLLRADMSDFEPQPLADWLVSKGESRTSFQFMRAKHQQQNPAFSGALDAVEAVI